MSPRPGYGRLIAAGDRTFLHARQRTRVDQHVVALRALRNQTLDLLVVRELFRGDLGRALERDLRGELLAVLLDVVDARLAVLPECRGSPRRPWWRLRTGDFQRLRVELDDLRVGVDLELDRLALECDVLVDALQRRWARPCGSSCRPVESWVLPAGACASDTAGMAAQSNAALSARARMTITSLLVVNCRNCLEFRKLAIAPGLTETRPHRTARAAKVVCCPPRAGARPVPPRPSSR